MKPAFLSEGFKSKYFSGYINENGIFFAKKRICFIHLFKKF